MRVTCDYIVVTRRREREQRRRRARDVVGVYIHHLCTCVTYDYTVMMRLSDSHIIVVYIGDIVMMHS